MEVVRANDHSPVRSVFWLPAGDYIPTLNADLVGYSQCRMIADLDV